MKDNNKFLKTRHTRTLHTAALVNDIEQIRPPPCKCSMKKETKARLKALARAHVHRRNGLVEKHQFSDNEVKNNVEKNQFSNNDASDASPAFS